MSPRPRPAFAINVRDDGDSQLRFYQNVATANLTFPPQAPAPPPPAIDVVILKRNPDDTKERTDGLVVEDDQLTIGFVTSDFIQRASINGETFNVRRDDADPRFDWVLEQEFTPGRAGTFLLEVTALSIEGFAVNEAVTFRAIAAGGSNNDVLNDEPPSVITLKTVPKNEAKGVPVSIFPQLTFTEPVTHIPGNVTLVDSSGEEVGLTLSGVGPDGPIASIESAGAKVTSLTLVPMTGLKFGERYTLNLTSGIEDLDTDTDDNPAPKNLVPFTTNFTTFGPEALGGTEDKFGSAGIAVLGDRADLVENNFYFGTLRVFDVTDPVEPLEIPDAQATVDGRPVDIVGEDQLIAIATGPTNRSRPSNVYFFDVSSATESRWLGAATVASSAVDGFVSRIRLLDGVAYALTGRKGVQVIDVTQATDLFQDTIGTPFSPEYFSIVQRLNTAGQGFAQEAVSQAIPLTKDTTRDFFQTDLAAARIQTEVWAATTGEAPLFLVNPVTRATTGSVPVETTANISTMTSGSAIEMGQVGGRNIALIAGWGSVGGEPPGWTFAVVDVSTPATPATLDVIALPLDTAPTDILLTESTAIVASQNQAALVNVANPEKPLFAGTIDMVGGVLAVTQSGLLLSTARSAFGGDTEGGGVRTAALARTPVIREVTAAVVVRPTGTPVTHKDISIEFDVVPGDVEVTHAEVEILRSGTLVETLTVQLAGSNGVATWPAGRTVQPGSTYTARATVDPGTEREAQSAEKVITLADVALEVSPDNATEVSADDGLAYVTAQVFYQDPEDPENEISVDDGAEIRWEIMQGSGTLSTTTSFTRSGLAATRLRTSTRPGDSFVIKGTLTKFKISGEEFQSVQEESTALLLVVPGVPSAIALTASKTAYRSDGTDTVEFVAEVRDAAGNLVVDGTDVAWSVEESVTQFQSPVTSTTNGRATAILLAPTLPVDQIVEARAGLSSATTTISVSRVTGELASTSQTLDIAQAETATITATVQAADGTPVTWITSNGALSGAEQVTNG